MWCITVWHRSSAGPSNGAADCIYFSYTSTGREAILAVREPLAIVFGAKKFHQYLYGQRFTTFTDHKPLQYLFGENRAVPPMAAARIQLTLSAYSYRIAYKPVRDQTNAHALSRLLPDYPKSLPLSTVTTLLMEHLAVTASNIKDWTNQDPLLAKVKNFLLVAGLTGTQTRICSHIFNKGMRFLQCLLRGSRVIVPPQGCK